MPDLKPLGLRCQWTQRGGYPQCRLLLGHEGAHEFFSHPPTGSTTGVISSAQPPGNPEHGGSSD